MRYLGVDYGSRRVGLAFSDEQGTMGFPHSIIPNTPRLVDEVCALIVKEQVGAVVIGESRNLEGGENAIAKDARAFGEQIAERAQKPIFFESEVFTSAEARRLPADKQERPSRAPKKHVDVDASAAALILTSYLSKARSHLASPTMDKPKISIEEFSKIEVKIGTVRSAERVPETDKLIRLIVDFGESSPAGESLRQIVSGIAAYVIEPESLVGRQLSFVTNLEPRTIRGIESNGMLFAVGEGESFAFVVPDRDVPSGTSAH